MAMAQAMEAVTRVVMEGGMEATAVMVVVAVLVAVLATATTARRLGSERRRKAALVRLMAAIIRTLTAELAEPIECTKCGTLVRDGLSWLNSPASSPMDASGSKSEPEPKPTKSGSA